MGKPKKRGASRKRTRSGGHTKATGDLVLRSRGGAGGDSVVGGKFAPEYTRITKASGKTAGEPSPL